MVRDNARDTNKRRSNEKLGRLAEFVAAAFLMLKGYRILACRVRSRFGEIDLIAVRGRHLAFVEVRYRDTFEAADNSITHTQANRITTAAEQWVGRSTPSLPLP
jgi:putative endonuclease